MPFKIVYAASDRGGAGIQYKRVMDRFKGSNHIIKTAAFKSSNLDIPSIDWNLDSLKNIFYPHFSNLDSNNLRAYHDQIKSFDPDLIISDLEIYTSYVGNLLNKRVWQVSPLLLHYALSDKDKHNQVDKSFSTLFEQLDYVLITNILTNSDRNFVYSHFGDYSVNIDPRFEFIRPYHLMGKQSPPCHHNIVSALLYNDKSLIGLLQQYKDAVAFTKNTNEDFNNITLKSINDQDEYACNLRNTNFFINQGYSSYMADAFYNQKYSYIHPDYKDMECLMNLYCAKHFETGELINKLTINDSPRPINVIYNERIKYLHEHIEELT